MKNACLGMCVILCRMQAPIWEMQQGYVKQIGALRAAKHGVQTKGMIFQTRSSHES